MTETILNSLYWQTLFLQNEGSLEEYLQKKEDIFSFVQGILFLRERTSFFTIDYRRAIKLRFILLNLRRQNIYLRYRENGDLFDKIVAMLNYCDLIERSKNNFISHQHDEEHQYSLSEAEKRHLTFSVLPDPKEIDSSIIFEYSIISSLVNGIQLDPSYKLSQLLNAFSLLITTYQEILYENPRIYFFITTYLTILLEKMNLESFFHKKRIRIILEEYQQLQKDFMEGNEISFRFGQNKKGS